MHTAAEFREQPAHRIDDGSRAAHGVVHAPFALQVVNECVDGGGLKWVAADEQGVETEHAPEHGVFDVLRHKVVDGLVRLQPDEVGHNGQHVGELEEWPV